MILLLEGNMEEEDYQKINLENENLENGHNNNSSNNVWTLHHSKLHGLKIPHEHEKQHSTEGSFF